MSIKPLDMQTNINQMHEVAKNTKDVASAVVAQQSFLDNEANEKSKKTDSRVDTSKEGNQITKKGEEEKSANKDFDFKHRKKDEEDAKSNEVASIESDRLGCIIDIRK